MDNMLIYEYYIFPCRGDQLYSCTFALNIGQTINYLNDFKM